MDVNRPVGTKRILTKLLHWNAYECGEHAIMKHGKHGFARHALSQVAVKS